jgi:hypothetical protein
MSYLIISCLCEKSLIESISSMVNQGYIPVGSPFMSEVFGQDRYPDCKTLCQAVYKPKDEVKREQKTN